MASYDESSKGIAIVISFAYWLLRRLRGFYEYEIPAECFSESIKDFVNSALKR